jgi:PleD family two-component response regulator
MDGKDVPLRYRLKVLVVDDDPVLLEIVRERLERAGCDVSVRDEALGTTQVVASVQPDVVLLDVNMPALSGTELLQLIRRRSSADSTRIILFSSLEPAELDDLVVKTGADGGLSKALRAQDFLDQFSRLTARM